MPKVFGVIEEITLLGYVIRTLLVGIVAFLVGRFIPKRAFHQLTIYDFILAWILGALTVAPLLDGKISFTYIIVPLLTLFFWHFAFSMVSMKSRKLAFFFHGKPAILIDDGKIVRNNMKKHFFNIDLLMAELRLKNIFDIFEVKYAILEPNGHLSVSKKESFSPVKPKDMNLIANATVLPIIIIYDGRLVEENLMEAGVDRDWLMNNLAMYQLNKTDDVYLATIDGTKKLMIFSK